MAAKYSTWLSPYRKRALKRGRASASSSLLPASQAWQCFSCCSSCCRFSQDRAIATGSSMQSADDGHPPTCAAVGMEGSPIASAYAHLMSLADPSHCTTLRHGPQAVTGTATGHTD
ncbi:hypothetical protein HaLaN_13252 [Haematococcus lacustris]|uniref:Uncharacterized protein n=1 Tax=Haematococcus lacustris TaxID=44745 RepID=A0A699Z2H8_HAELA|nr:hypothetical protein HaLaN_13252 [Haematococcus lacustris]